MGSKLKQLSRKGNGLVKAAAEFSSIGVYEIKRGNISQHRHPIDQIRRGLDDVERSRRAGQVEAESGAAITGGAEHWRPWRGKGHLRDVRALQNDLVKATAVF